MELISNRINGKRTKVVATIGPTSRDEETIRQMIRTGLDVARINFSHGDHETHSKAIDDVRRIAYEEGAVVAILCDIQGPKIRIGKIANEPIVLQTGDKITLTLDEADGTNNVVSLPHPEFVRDIKAGMPLLLDDGKMEFVVRATTGRSLMCEVVVPGNLTSRKGVTAPNAKLTLSAITEKDRRDVEFAISKNTEYLAMSFVRSEDDIREMRWLIRHLGGNAAIIAKIEKHEALENIESIVDSSDGIMVARGDLGVETPAEEVPFHQKRIIRLCNATGKPVITATQMLNSMVDNPRPTRAEASDVYNAILDGTDAVMLSNETASGMYPIRAVETMVNIAAIAEQHIIRGAAQDRSIVKTELEGREAISDGISQATCQIAETLNCKAIVTSTLTGYTSRRVAKERPRTPILCVTPNEITYRRMALVWGVFPLLVPEFNTIDEMIGIVVRAAVNARLVQLGDLLVIIAGVPFGIGGQTNFLKIHTIGEAGELELR
ncbi:MAG: pyruvate kinase [Anaerolineae bacterium]|uniref:pyruvate kinase n=1 Tax=Candidatus Flexifilum breve TaxID=3140694 RepID=UPI001AD37B95|nr:pyruvate kinase [Chloroflexota bacterium]MBK9749762.1 pyruvate kinase [Chloroflexota bacterium]MBN8635769.1 pyruvate kinase [Anaerolineae bacterium]